LLCELTRTVHGYAKDKGDCTWSILHDFGVTFRLEYRKALGAFQKATRGALEEHEQDNLEGHIEETFYPIMPYIQLYSLILDSNNALFAAHHPQQRVDVGYRARCVRPGLSLWHPLPHHFQRRFQKKIRSKILGGRPRTH
jgi:hypothetical protein